MWGICLDCLLDSIQHLSAHMLFKRWLPGCILPPFLFIIVIDCVMRRAVDPPDFGIGWQNAKHLTHLDFTDNIARIAENEQVYQEMTTQLAAHGEMVGLHISHEKSKIMKTNPKKKINQYT